MTKLGSVLVWTPRRRQRRGQRGFAARRCDPRGQPEAGQKHRRVRSGRPQLQGRDSSPCESRRAHHLRGGLKQSTTGAAGGSCLPKQSPDRPFLLFSYLKPFPAQSGKRLMVYAPSICWRTDKTNPFLKQERQNLGLKPGFWRDFEMF